MGEDKVSGGRGEPELMPLGLGTGARMGKRRKPQKAAVPAPVAAKKAAVERHDDPIDTNQPDVYAFNDTPKAFQRLLQPVPKFKKQAEQKQSSEPTKAASKEKNQKPGMTKQNAQDKEWDILPGESFRQFNARIQAAEKGSSERQQQREPLNKTAGQEFAEARGLSQRRKKYLKSRDERIKAKKSKTAFSDDEEEYRWESSVRFGERVEAPPQLKIKPKAFKHKQK